jgi:hypothetical protein
MEGGSRIPDAGRRRLKESRCTSVASKEIDVATLGNNWIAQEFAIATVLNSSLNDHPHHCLPDCSRDNKYIAKSTGMATFGFDCSPLRVKRKIASTLRRDKKQKKPPKLAKP